MKKTYLLLGLVLIAVVLLAGGYLLWQRQTATPNISPSPASQTPTDSSSVDLTMKSYSGEGFTFDYPSNFVVVDNNTNPKTQGEVLLSIQMAGTENGMPNGVMGISTARTSGMESVLPSLYGIDISEVWTNPSYQARYTRVNDISVAGELAHSYDVRIEGDDSGSQTMTILSHNNNYFVFTEAINRDYTLQPGDLEYNVKFPEIFADILASFSFTE